MAFNFKSFLKPKQEKNPDRKEEKRESDARAMQGVMVALDNYEDIFSDFDTRPFSERGLSDDFLKELSHRTIETPKGDFEVFLVLPETLRKEKDEAVIKSRLRKHFFHEVKRILASRDEKKRHGYLFFALGTVLLIIEVFLIEQAEIVSKLVLALAQGIALPAGWFFGYIGLEKIVQPYGEDKGDFEFVRKMQSATYRFASYEDLEADARVELERLEKVAREAREKADSLARQEISKLEAHTEPKLQLDAKEKREDKAEAKERKEESKERKEEKKDEKHDKKD